VLTIVNVFDLVLLIRRPRWAFDVTALMLGPGRIKQLFGSVASTNAQGCSCTLRHVGVCIGQRCQTCRMALWRTKDMVVGG